MHHIEVSYTYVVCSFFALFQREQLTSTLFCCFYMGKQTIISYSILHTQFAVRFYQFGAPKFTELRPTDLRKHLFFKYCSSVVMD